MELNIVVYRNNVDARMLFEKMQLQAESGPVLLLLSPGPGAPHEAGCMPELLSMVQGHFPVLGICLGHQAIVAHYGGTVGRAEDVMHGKSSAITHTGEAMFAGMPQPLHVARYHSLMALELPDGLTPLAKVGTTVMAVYQSDDKMLGFQFHPESILTAEGSRLLLQSIHYLTKED